MAGFIAAQGDVLIVEAPMPRAVVPVETGGVATLARGEATGHHHSIFSDRVALFREDGAGGGLFMLVGGDAPVSLQHQEHAPVEIPPGTFRVIRQRTFVAGMAKRVTD